MYPTITLPFSLMARMVVDNAVPAVELEGAMTWKWAGLAGGVGVNDGGVICDGGGGVTGGNAPSQETPSTVAVTSATEVVSGTMMTGVPVEEYPTEPPPEVMPLVNLITAVRPEASRSV